MVNLQTLVCHLCSKLARALDACPQYLSLGDLQEEVYMRPPPGFRIVDLQHMCRLKKSLYGLRQAPRYWFFKLTIALRKFGFVQSYADYSLFTYHVDDIFIYVLIYVDDLLIMGNSLSTVNKFKASLSSTFHIRIWGS